MRSFVAVLAALTVAAGLTPAVAVPALADDIQAHELSVRGGTLVDGYGREVVLRGFNVSGETKLAENGFLPFASATDAQRSATAMRQLTGANAVRFLLSWTGAEPVRGQLDAGYLARLTDQLKAFLDQGFEVLPDYHQDLYSRYLFNTGSWYTGDGAPQWVVTEGNYPPESCGICVHWGQNVTQNAAVQDATSDFWHDKYGVQDEFLSQATQTMTYLRAHLSAAEFAGVAGMDPFNEPYAGRYDSGQDSRSWEQSVLWPFFQRFRAAMDTAGWQDKPAFVEPNMFWNANISFEQQTGGFLDTGAIGTRYVFNTHFYDELAQSGVLMPGKAGDGQYSANFGTVRDRASALGTAAIVTEFGHPMSGYTSDKTPTVDKAMYQALDSRLSGANWWADAASSGPVLSGTQWHWDIYSGQHHELMNGNPDKVETAGDGWNGEDYSAVDSNLQLRQDSRLLDRIYPAAVAGHTVAFSYEDRSRDGGQVLTWNPVPSSMPATASLVGSGRYGVLVWQGTDTGAPTELVTPADMSPTVVTDLPASAVSTSGDRVLLAATPGPHYALLAEPSTAPTDAQLASVRAELAAWLPNVVGGGS